MNAFLRAASCAAGLALAFHGIEYFSPDRLTVPLSTAATQVQALAVSSDEREPVDDAQFTLLLRMTRRRQAVLDLIGRRITLREAVACFRDLENTMSASQQLRLRLTFPARSDAEHFYLEILAHAVAELRGHDSRCRALMDYLRPQVKEAASWSPEVSIPAVVLDRDYLMP
jgi:hypothetical protein